VKSLVLGLLLAPSLARADAGAAVADSAGADSVAVAADSVVAATPRVRFEPDPVAWELATFRLSRSVDVEIVSFRELDDPVEPIGMLSLADVLRLRPATRTREISPGPTVETFAQRGAGSGRSALVWPGQSLTVPGTSGPHTHEVMLSEIGRLEVVAGGAAALYGPDAASGAVILRPREIHPNQLHSRAMAEEGVDDYQRGAFQAATRVGSGSIFATTESRRIEGFYAGTKEVDRQFSGAWRGRLPLALEGSFRYRELSADGRSGFFEPPVNSVLTKRSEVAASLFRRTGESRGVLVEAGWLRERLEDLSDPRPTREIRSPRVDVTVDLPDVAGAGLTARGEWAHWETERVEGGERDEYRRLAGAIRATRALGPRAFATATARFDRRDGRNAWQGRLEGEWSAERLALFGVASRNERFPDRGAVGSAPEVHQSATAGARLRVDPIALRLAAYATRVDDLRPDPTFDEIQRRAPVLGAPVGDGEILGTTLGLETQRFRLPGAGVLGSWRFRTSATLQRAENLDTGARLAGRPRVTWAGEGLLQRTFFRDELLARVRGRLTHWGDRVDEAGAAVRDVWLQDVILEAEIGDAVVFYRFHDLLERGDEVEPGYFFPGFSRYFGLTWRFVG